MQKKKLADEDLLRLKLDLIKRMLADGFSQSAIHSLLKFIRKYVSFAKPETTAKFEEEYSSLAKNDKSMGLIEMDREEVRMEEKTRFVAYLLQSTAHSDDKIASIVGVSPSFVQEIRTRLHFN